MPPVSIAMNGSGQPHAENMNTGKTVTITKKISGGLNASEKIPSLRLHFPGVYAIFQRIIIQERQKP
jgi:hypothetical protein